MGEKQTLHGVIFKDADSDQWVAMCLELDVVTQGDNEEDAKAMLKEAVELRLEDMTQDDLDVLYQRIEGEPLITQITIDAPALLRS